MMAPKAVIAGAARIQTVRWVGALAARHFADLLGLTPRPDHLRGAETADISILNRL
jgi:hypothetical protein